MSTFIFRFLVIALLGGCFSSGFNNCNALAEDSAKEQAINDFSIDKLSKIIFEGYSKRQGFLDTYLTCLAVARDNVSVCNNLSKDEARLCSRDFYGFHRFFSELVVMGSVTQKFMEACQKQKGKPTAVDCRKIAESFFAQDVSVCDNSISKDQKNDCMAIRLRDPKYCSKGDKKCANRVYYIQALETNDVNKCNAITDEYFSTLCKGSVSRDESVCKKCKSFRNFFEQYYPTSKDGFSKEADSQPVE